MCAIGLVIKRSSPEIALINVDLPTLGFPITEILVAFIFTLSIGGMPFFSSIE